MNIKKAILKVFSANFLQLVSSLIIGFVVPTILSISDYANLKTYSLYMSYIAILNLGFIDGLYIKYGGKKYDDIDKQTIKGEHIFLILFQLIVSVIIFIISLITKNIIILLFSISILPIMVQGFFKNIYQATGKFDKYTRIAYIYSITYVILNIVLAFVFKSQNYILYCLAIYGANLISVIVFEIKFIRELKGVKPIINKDTFKNIKVGIFVLLGNLSVVGLFGIDKWFVKLFLSTEDFAFYSFAVSMLNLINVLVNAISVTFYNYLCLNNTKENINKLKKYLIVLGGAASIAYFGLAMIVNVFIKKYIPSLDIIAITFAIFPYMILINALYVNLYKVNKNERHYFKVVMMMLLVSIVYNIIAILIFHNTISIAYATILTVVTWVIYSTYDIKEIIFEKKLCIYIGIITIVFLLCTHFLNWIIGGIIYFIVYLVLTFAFNKDIIVNIKDTILNYIKNKKNVIKS